MLIIFPNILNVILINNKLSETVLLKLKEYIKEIGIPSIIHTDNDDEFISNIFELYLKENKINHIKGGLVTHKAKDILNVKMKIILI